MIDVRGPFRVAVLFVLISAILHIAAVAVGGLSQEALSLLPFGVLYLLFALGLARGMRWLAYVVFLVVGIGGSVALASMLAPVAIPAWWRAAIMVADWIAVLALLVALWCPATPAA